MQFGEVKKDVFGPLRDLNDKSLLQISCTQLLFEVFNLCLSDSFIILSYTLVVLGLSSV